MALILSLSATGLLVTPIAHIAPPLPEPACMVASRLVVSSTANPFALTKAFSLFPTTDLLAAELFGFGKEFTGYKNPKTAEREATVEIPPPKTDFKEKYSSSPKVEIDLSSYFDVETDAEKAAKEKEAAMERKKAEAFARENLAAEEAKAKVAMVEKIEKSSVAREARRLKEEQQAAKEEAKANAAAEREAA